jgi:hypothetical protein
MINEPLTAARDNGDYIKRDFVKNHCYKPTSVISLTSITGDELKVLTEEKKLISIPCKGTDDADFLVYPIFQFIGKTFVRGLEVLSNIFLSPWDLIMFLNSGDYYLSGRLPIDVLIEGDIEAVITAAENCGKQRSL